MIIASCLILKTGGFVSDELTDIRQRLSNMVRRGVISAVIAGNPVRVRVRLGQLTTPPLPWCNAMSGKHLRMRNLPSVGDAVTIFSEAGDLRNGRVYPGTNIDAVPVPDGEEGDFVMQFDGLEVRYSPDSKQLAITLGEGGKYVIKGNGVLDGDVEIKKSLTVNQNINGKQEISDKTGKISAIRDVFDNHDHPENGDGRGTTNSPNQKMGGDG